MKYAVINDPEKSFVAIGKTRLSFSSIIEELIDNGIDWESKRTLNCSINVSRIDDDNIKVDYKDNSEGIESEKIPEALSIGNQLNKNNLHCHGFGLSCVLAVLQQTHKTNNWEIRTCGKLVKGPIGKEIEITDDDRNTNGLNMTFVYPIKNLKTLATHKNTKSIKRFMMGLSSILGSKYRRYIQAETLKIKLTYPSADPLDPPETRNIKACIPIYNTYSSYDIEAPGGKIHKVEFGKIESVETDRDVPDLYFGKSSSKGYFTVFKGKILGCLKLDFIYDSKFYSEGKKFNYKEWYAQIILDPLTSGDVTNVIKDGVNEENQEIQYIIEAIRNHKIDNMNDLEYFLKQNPGEIDLQNKVYRGFKNHYETDGWKIKKEFSPFRQTNITVARIDLVRYHPQQKKVYWYEMKKDIFKPDDMRQFAGYRHLIEALIGKEGDHIHTIIKDMKDYEHTFVALCDKGELNDAAQLLLETCPEEYAFFITEDYNKFV